MTVTDDLLGWLETHTPEKIHAAIKAGADPITPISYAQCGLYPQFHRREQDVYANIDYLYRRRYGNKTPVRNVPNKYVDKDFDLGAARGGQAAERVDRDG